ncbi:MAG: chromate transporter [Lachnospirales bacterium]
MSILPLLQMCLVFAKIGLMSFGGGYAMIPFIQYETVSRGWMTNESILDMIAVSQVTPGPITTNMATFVGYSNYGFWGGIFATIGVTVPPIVLILLITRYVLDKLTPKVREKVFFGLRPTISALLLITALTIPFADFFEKVDFKSFTSLVQNTDYFGIIISVMAYISIKVFKKNSIGILVLCGLSNVVFNYFTR